MLKTFYRVRKSTSGSSTFAFIRGYHACRKGGLLVSLICTGSPRNKVLVGRRAPVSRCAAFSSMAETSGTNPCGQSEAEEPLVKAALRVLYEPNASKKCELTYRTAELWRAGKLKLSTDIVDLPNVPDRPARDNTVCHGSACF
jgi:hypothetical protein